MKSGAPPAVYLCAPVNALVEGIYEEHIPLAQIGKHGDFGLGTFDDLDGEMVMLDGQVYQITGDGRVHEVTEPVSTPFACVTFYSPISHDELDATDERSRSALDRASPRVDADRERSALDRDQPPGTAGLPYADFQRWLLDLLPSPNLFYALRIDGSFAHVRVRSVPRQENYRPLVDVARDQPEFTFADVEGTLAGFYTPAFLESLSVPGLHLHFLSADRTAGGHLLACRPRRIRAGVQFISTLELALPLSLDYLTCDFARDTGADLDKAEK
jgi:acetolactate decarboxylase